MKLELAPDMVLIPASTESVRQWVIAKTIKPIGLSLVTGSASLYSRQTSRHTDRQTGRQANRVERVRERGSSKPG